MNQPTKDELKLAFARAWGLLLDMCLEETGGCWKGCNCRHCFLEVDMPESVRRWLDSLSDYDPLKEELFGIDDRWADWEPQR